MDKVAYQKDWYEKNKAQHKVNAARNKKAAQKAARLHVQRLKESAPCVDCGVKYPHYVMQYDHLGDKKDNVSRLVQSGYSIKTIDTEIAKCDLLCANCHAARTWNRFR